MTNANNVATFPPLSATLAHDLRTPLNQIIGYSEMMIEKAQETEKNPFLPDLKKICAAGHELLGLINDKSDAPPKPRAENVSWKQPDRVAYEIDILAIGAVQGLLLVVDDIEANRDVLSRRLEGQGYGVAAAKNGEEALSMLRENAFDLVLLDILMPEMDGYEVLKQIKESPELCNIPVIMISAVNELDSVVRCIELGAEDYISKPFNPVLLKARVGASLQKKRAHDREMALYDQLDHNFKNLQELEKLREDLTHMIIHDLRTPLTSVISGMQTMEVVGALNEPQREIMNIALFGGDTLLGIINELLDVEKLESGSMPMDYAELSPGNLVELAVSQVTSLATDKKQTVRARIATDLPLFRGDAGKLCRTLVNLLGNAIKFTPEGGEITASASYGPGRSSLLFSVRDTGVGIPAEAFGRIFEKFGQVESRQLGTGLGLTFCKLAVNAHGGIIEVESEPGMGSTFSFTIPIPSMA